MSEAANQQAHARPSDAPTTNGRERFWLGDWLVAPESCVLERQEQKVHLEPRVMDVLCVLCAEAGDIVSAEDLLTRVWRGTFYGDNPVHKSIAQLRRALGDSASAPEYIETVRKRGYRVITTVRHADADPGRGSDATPAWTGGNPFRGLQAFEEAHASIYFGRDAAIGRAAAALQRQLEDGLGFVLLLGPSGSGKTSLVRAGLLPVLMRRHGLDGLHVLDSARLDASGTHGDLLSALAQAMLQWTVAERPVFLAAELDWLREQLRETPDVVVHRVEQALVRARPDGHSGTRELLALVIDQSEGLLADATDENLLALGQVLDCLARSDRIAVLLTCRSDFYPVLLQRLPQVLALKGDHGHIDLAPMSAGELALCIRGPARAAGLSFEVDTSSQLRLDDCLRDDAIGQPESLPLLQHALDILYAQRSADGRLGFAAYRQIGGLAGAIASRAEQVYASLDSVAQGALPGLLDRLVALNPGHGGLVARQIEVEGIDGEAGRRLVDTFVEARLFVSVLDHGRRRVGIAHEALLRHWPRVRTWVERNRQRLQAHARIAHAAQRWQQDQRRDDLLLLSDRQIGEARDLYNRAPTLLNNNEREFIRRSLRLSGRRRGFRIAALSVFVLVAAIAAVMGLRANLASAEAERRRQEAEALVEFLLGDLAERLRPLGRLDVLASVAERALQSLQPGGRSDLASSQALQQRARALSTLGEVLLEQGDSGNAAHAFQQAADTLEPLITSSRVDPEILEAAGNLAFWQGMVDYQAHHVVSAKQHWQRYASISERRMAKQPLEPRAWLELSYALNNLGAWERDQGDMTRSIEHFQASLDLKQRYVDAVPEDMAMQAELADSLSWLGSALEREGRLVDAAELYTQELAIFERLAKEQPRDARWRNRLALSQTRNGVLALAVGRRVEADQHLGLAVEELDRLVRLDPSNRTWLRDLAHARLRWASALRALDRQSHAQKQLGLAVTAFDTLTEPDDAPVEWQRLSAESRLGHWEVAPPAEDLASRLPELVAIIRDLEGLQEQATTDASITHILASAYVVLGDALQRTDAPAEARRYWSLAEQLLEPERESSNRYFLEPLMLALARLGKEDEVATIHQRLIATGYKHPALNPIPTMAGDEE